MKTLTLLRHAKSSWDDSIARDFDRPLNAKGQRAAVTMGRHMKSLGLEFDHVVVSPALRVTQTIEHLVIGYGETLAPHEDRRIYLASAATLLDIVHALPDAYARVLMIGHNPGLEDLVLLLVPDRTGDTLRDGIEEKYPTAALAELTLDTDHWANFAANAATLSRFIPPRDLDAALGPDKD
jgi:phosphohistidine phosphatase